MSDTFPSAETLDAQDELAHFQKAFSRHPGQIYLDGNSLGLMSKQAKAALLRVLDEWELLGIDGWTQGTPPWFSLAEGLAAQFAPLVGAQADEVIVANSTTVNLHQLLATLFEPSNGRHKIVLDALAFPSDVYAVQSHLRLRGLDPTTHLVTIASRDGYTLDEEDIVDSLTPDVGMAVLPSVVYTSGQLLDMARLTAEAHQRGILIGFDCSHSVGAVPHALNERDVDFAFWCHYKYLNGGPGAPGGLYLNRRHFGRMPGLAGWFSSEKTRQFDMAPTLTPALGAGALQIGSPPILALAPLHGALAVVADAGIERLRTKSLHLTAYLRELAEAELTEFGVSVVTPREDDRRGGHLALVHPEAIRICKALKEASVVPDYRAPDIIRLAPVPLYTSFADCQEAIMRLKRILAERLYTHYDVGRDLVA
jgi:kynureninase